MKTYKIILVEDDDEAGFFTKEFLEDSGFKVDLFALSTDAISNLKFKKYDLLLLDLNLPDFDGFEILKSLKNSTPIPVIVISAYSDIKIKLNAFKFGALDYIVKPYNLEELEARIWAVFAKQSFICDRKNLFYREDQQIYFKDEKLDLTQTEFEILSTLIQKSNTTVSRENLASKLSKVSSQRSLDYHIKNIRQKIDDDGSNPKYLKTEYGVGYMLNFLVL